MNRVRPVAGADWVCLHRWGNEKPGSFEMPGFSGVWIQKADLLLFKLSVDHIVIAALGCSTG